MPTVTIKQFSRDEIRNYVITDFDKFKAQAEVRLLALGASALLYWMDLVKGRFSVSASARYLESLYWDVGNPSRIVLGIRPDTFASMLEGGQQPFPLNPGFLKKAEVTKGRMSKKGKTLRPAGKRYRVIPMSSEEDTKYVSPTKAPQASIAGISETVEKKSPQVASFIIKSQLSGFDRVSAGSSGMRPKGFFIRNAHPQFRVITPEKTWMHPGIKAALLSNQVSEWAKQQREKFVGDILGGNSGIILPGFRP